ncbi:hypothetical protein TNCV_4579861 [Trichonephila clavipes]|nr:hypothetical protein TNCV_4579861 [Trichonephila clavipes]
MSHLSIDHLSEAGQILFLAFLAVVHCSFDVNPYYIYDDSGLGYGGYGLGLRDYGYPAYGHRDIIYDGYGFSRLGYGRYGFGGLGYGRYF